MATERDLELLDDYLSNRLEGQEKKEFEKKLESDSALKGEYNLQQQLIEGIRSARIAELKTMMNQTVIPGSSTTSLVAKISLWAILTAVVGAGVYFLSTNSDKKDVSKEVTVNTSKETPALKQPEEKESTRAISTPQPQDKTEKEDVQTEKITSDPVTKNTESKQKQQASTPAKQPNLDPYDPTKEMDNTTDKPEAFEEATPDHIATSSIKVEIESNNKKLDFHYQFKEGKLFLYGSFEKDLYEILEFFNNNKRTVFLYYNSNFYLLDETQVKPAPLKAITDQALIQKLREYRGK